MRIIDESTAAALAYNLQRKDDLEKNVLVFNLGSETLDVSVFQMIKGEIKIKSSHVDNNLGGQLFDNEMVKYCIESFKKQYGIDLARECDTTSSRLRRIRNECERQKQVLSEINTTVVEISAIESEPELLNLHVPFSRELFETLNKNHFIRCMKIVQLVLTKEQISKSDIDDVILVGGSTRIPKIQKMLTNFFGKTPSSDECVVAEGAAIEAWILNDQPADEIDELNLTEDYTPFSIQIVDNDDFLQFIEIPKNTCLPYSDRVEWTTNYVGKTSVHFKIYEGEHENFKNKNLLGQFGVYDIAPKKKGM